MFTYTLIYFNHKEHKDRKDQILNALSFHLGLSLFSAFYAFFAVKNLLCALTANCYPGTA